MRIFIIGHKSPDLDAIASAVVYKELLETLKRYEGAEIIAVKAERHNKETELIFTKFNAEMTKELDEYDISDEDLFILVDHNENTQRHGKIIMDNVLEIIDHHKVNLVSAQPLRVITERMGATCTVIYNEALRYNTNWPSDQAKGLILSSILSDTQGLKSSTTTGTDSEIAHKLADDLDININDLTVEIFKSKSDIADLTAKQLVTKDYKIFKFGGKSIFVNQIETVDPAFVLEKKSELVEALNEVKTELGAEYGLIAVTDILNVNTHMIYTNELEEKLVNDAFLASGINNVADIGPKMSRKKDIAPALEKTLS
jgi:manganese-dependent inorganic pyrophosphatase